MNINEILGKKKYQEVIDTLSSGLKKNIYIGNCAPNIAKMLALLSHKDNTIIYVTKNIFEASKAFEIFEMISSGRVVSFYPVEEFISLDIVASSQAFRLARMMTIYNIINDVPQIIVTNVEGLTKSVMSKESLKKGILNYQKLGTISIENVKNDLIIRGYKLSSITENPGTFSVRGSIVDIYPINQNNPIRLSFFDDEIETIKEIDVETQMSKGQINEVTIFPLYDIFYEEALIPSIKNKLLKHNKLSSRMDKVIFSLENYTDIESLYIYLPLIDPNYTSLLSIIDNPICFYDDYNELLNYEQKINEELYEYIMQQEYTIEKGFKLNLFDLLQDAKINVFINQFVTTLKKEIPLDKYFDLKTSSIFEYNNNLKAMFDDIELNIEKTYLITHIDEEKLAYIEEILETRKLHYYIIDNFKELRKGKINVCVSNDALGFSDYEEMFEVITPNEYAPLKITRNAKYQKYYNQSTKIYNKDELDVGDYIVHQDYGIGKYLGIKTIELRNKKNDYLGIQYANESKIYIPIENIYLLEKYIGSKNQLPKLNDVNNKDWIKKKARIKEKIVEIAKNLIKVQAARESVSGFQYEKDSPLQLEFEHDFPFTETADQLKAIEDVKKDMESTKPVDRLICGDVGFGKTEVAMRAAFKAIDNNKQVALLAPTTVLTRQHFYTFKERFQKYGIRVELINRFVPIVRQKQIMEDLKKGYVDIIIGTHRLLSKDFIYKDLGLLIVDEEQRFGVTHKEKIKNMKNLVDVITLTATPIPRTLQMSLSGLRDLSLIETPPVNRLPIQTYVLESNPSVIREAINREIGRGGQVFYLLNRISELENKVAKLKQLVPHAKIGLIHGQLSKDQIEQELTYFLDGSYNVLMCTTIIETGIDIPNANTLLIEKADILGLSQLYQIRGRVGRSDKIAYAYLMYDETKVLTETAEKRLDTIKEFTSLGSGYKIAMRDLAIRGAGDILGKEQSGNIDAIGMDMYMKLLKEAMAEVKGEPLEEPVKRLYNIDISRHVSTSYVKDDSIRIDIHRSISKITSRDAINSLITEYTDRYGRLSDDILLYMEEKYLEFLLKSRGVQTFKETDSLVTVTFDEESTSKMVAAELFKLSLRIAPKFKFKIQSRRIVIEINPQDYVNNYIYTLTKYLENICIN